MIKIISKFKIWAKGFFNKERPYNRPIRILIPVSILLVAGLTVGILYFVDYSKSPVLTLSNISSGKTTETNESNYSVNGKINESKGTDLFINGVKVKIGSDGSFIYSIKLVEGKNAIEFSLVKNGKEVKTVYTINRNVEKTAEAIVKEDANVSNKVQEETKPTPQSTPPQTTAPQNTIVDTPKAETKTEQPIVTPVAPPATPPEAPKPVDVRAKISADGCTYSFYAPAGYIMSFSSFDPKYPESGENKGSIPMPEEGIFVRSLDSAPFWVGVVISINIRETADGPILSSASKTVTSICGSDN